MSALITINRLGAKGDGVADRENGPVFIARSIPGDVFRMNSENSFDLETPSPHRVKAFCSVFGQCGGCV
ncbi:MAG: RNA methyltransferase, partial [Alphaproteobacteria bacterium]|nr:RNA methyltransferase [Alphaproteobacteria bacterium]